MSPNDRQLTRWAEARTRHHAATMAHRDAVHELEQAAAELVVAGAALAERIRIAGRAADLALRSKPVTDLDRARSLALRSKPVRA